MKAKATDFQIKAERDCIFFGSSFAAAWLSATSGTVPVSDAAARPVELQPVEPQPVADFAARARFAADRSPARRRPVVAVPAEGGASIESSGGGFSEDSEPAIPFEPLIPEGALVLKGQTCFIGRSKAPMETLRRLTDIISYLSGAATLAKCFTKDSRTPIFASPTQPLVFTDSVLAGRDQGRAAPLSKHACSSQSKPTAGGGKRSSKTGTKAPAAASDRKEALSAQNQTSGGRSPSQSEAESLFFWEQKALLAGGATLEPARLKPFQAEEDFRRAKPGESEIPARAAALADSGEAEYFCFDKNGFSLSKIKALAAKLTEGAKIGIGGALTAKDCSRLPEGVFQFARPELLQGRFPKAGMILTVL